GQESSLTMQERALRAAIDGEPLVFCDRASGLNERRPGLRRALRGAARGQFDELWVTHRDRLTRFGFDTLAELFAERGVVVRVLHQDERDASPEQELMEDFMALTASFSRRLYGNRSAAARARLLAEAGR